MRQGPNGRRGRGGRHSHPGGGHSGGGGSHNAGNNGGGQRRSAASLRHQTFDSNGPDVRVRGNAWQVHEKYQALARDAASAGDRVAAENYLQHAEHYYRIIEAINEATAAEMAVRGYTPQQGQQQPGQPGEQPAVGYQQQPLANGAMPQQQPGQQPQAQAEVQVRQKANPFFTPEEVEENQGGPTQLVAGR